MNKIAVQGIGRSVLLVGLSVVCAVLFVSMTAWASTTVNLNISTDGTLSVTGASTLTGLSTHTAGFISVASSTAVGAFNVSGLSSLTGFVSSASSTVVGTLEVTGLATFTNGFIAVASSTLVGASTHTGASTLSSTTITTLKVGQVGSGTTNVIAGYCVATVTFAALNSASSTQTYANCTPYTAGGTAITTLTAATSRVLVQATSSLPFHVLLQSASTTASNIINLSLLNISTSTLPAGGSIYAFNFWSFQ